MATGQGTIVFNFGAAPGTNVVTTAASDVAIGAGSKVEIYPMGTDSTATHNAYEHAMIGLGVVFSPVSVTAGVGFTGQAATMLRLTGTITARYVWAD